MKCQQQFHPFSFFPRFAMRSLRSLCRRKVIAGCSLRVLRGSNYYSVGVYLRTEFGTLEASVSNFIADFPLSIFGRLALFNTGTVQGRNYHGNKVIYFCVDGSCHLSTQISDRCHLLLSVLWRKQLLQGWYALSGT